MKLLFLSLVEHETEEEEEEDQRRRRLHDQISETLTFINKARKERRTEAGSDRETGDKVGHQTLFCLTIVPFCLTYCDSFELLSFQTGGQNPGPLLLFWRRSRRPRSCWDSW